MALLHSPDRLKRLLHPRSIAVVGASERAGSFGQRTLANLAGFLGTVHPVNPRYAEIGGIACYPSVSALPEVPDCVIIVVPREAVEAAVVDCVQAHVGGIVIYTSGFAETGKPEHVALQARVAALAREAGIPLIGPNCLGLFNAERQMSATFASTSRLPPLDGRPTIGMVSQSGAMGISLMQSVERGVRFSHLLTAGNSSDVDVADLLAYLAAQESCSVVACLFEGLANPAKLLEAANVARRHQKPVLIYKFATGSEGAAVAQSHTGSIAGSKAAYDALFEAAGFIQVDCLEGLVEAAHFFAKAPHPKAAGLGVLTGSGGAAILLADNAERHQLALPQLGPLGQAVLDSQVPEFGAPRNPCDLTAQAMNSPSAFPLCCDAFLDDPAIGAIVVCHNTAGFGQERMPLLSQLAQKHGKPVCIVWLSEWLEGPGAIEVEADARLALFRSAERCAIALRQWQAWWWRMQTVNEPAVADPRAAERRAELTDLFMASRGVVVEGGLSRRVLSLYGIPLVAEANAASAEQAVAAASRMGYPVALKIDSPDVAHKTEAGGVHLNLCDASTVANAFEATLRSAAQAMPQARLRGVVIQAMAPKGVEICVGGRIDPAVGPVITVALGGIWIELMGDARTALCPISPMATHGLLQRLRAYPLLKGYRGAAGVDLARLAEVVAAVSRLLDEARDFVAELDINPLICTHDQIVAVDALIVRRATQPALEDIRA